MSCSVKRFLENASYKNLRFIQFIPQLTFWITPGLGVIRLIPGVNNFNQGTK